MLKKLIEELRALDKKSPAYGRRFEEVLANIALLKDSSSIVPLVRLFEDDCEFPELMMSMMKTIEQFEAAEYLPELLETVPGFWARSPVWASSVFARILNADAYRAELLRLLPVQSIETKRTLRAIAKRITSKSPRHLARAEVVLQATEDVSEQDGFNEAREEE